MAKSIEVANIAYRTIRKVANFGIKILASNAKMYLNKSEHVPNITHIYSGYYDIVDTVLHCTNHGMNNFLIDVRNWVETL